MADLASLTLCLLTFICSAYMANGDLLTVPENVMGKVGTTITLSCSGLPGSGYRVMWTEFVTQELGRVISDDRNILPSHPNAARYTITGGPDEYNLQISGLSLLDGGRYVCADMLTNPPALFQGNAQLVVMDGDPFCTDILTDIETGSVLEDEVYSTECEVRYQGFFPPNLTWTGPGNYSLSNIVTGNEIWSRVNFVAHRDIEDGMFVATTRFVESPTGYPPDYATNVPDYQFVYSSPPMIVIWGPKGISISPRKDFYDVGDVLLCEADGKPAPSFIWSNLRTLVTEPFGQTYTIPAELLGTDQVMRCNANSVIGGSLYTADAFANVSIPAITQPPTTTPTTTPTVPPADSSCLDLTGQWTSTNPNAMMCIEVDTKGNILVLLRNGTDSFFVTGSGKTVYNDYRHVGFTAIWPQGAPFGVAGFSGECHRCFGNEIILASGLERNKANSPGCGQSAGTRLTTLYAFTRYGPPCRLTNVDVYRPKPEHIKTFGIQPEHIIM